MTALLTTPYPHIQVQNPVTIRSDTWPANVTFSFGDNPFTRARAIVTLDRVLILVEGGTQNLVLYEAPLLDVEGSRRQIVATTEDGQITITKQSGCGCGSGLKSYRPFAQSARLAVAI